MNDNNIRIPPTRRNGVNAYLQRYLNTVTDWNTYGNVAPEDFSATVKDVTHTFFSPKKLKGMGLLLGLHLSQQFSASLLTILLRSTLRGNPLDTYKGITIRQSRLLSWWQGEDLPSLALLKRFPTFKPLKHLKRLNSIKRFVQMADAYYFHEGGRTWHCLTWQFDKKQMTILTLASFPHRSYYFDRPLPYNQAVDLALGLLDPDSISGFLGHTNELDCLLPAIWALKLGLYWFNWLLIDPDERDDGGPDVDGYDRWFPLPPHNPNTPPTPSGFGSPTSSFDNGPGSAPQQHYWSHSHKKNSPSLPSQFLQPTPITIPLRSPFAINETISYTCQHAFSFLLDNGSPSGLAIVPQILATSGGSLQEDTSAWQIVHTDSGLSLITEYTLPSPNVAVSLAHHLVSLTDWRTPWSQLSQPALQQAEFVIQRFFNTPHNTQPPTPPPPPPHNGFSPPPSSGFGSRPPWPGQS